MIIFRYFDGEASLRCLNAIKFLETAIYGEAIWQEVLERWGGEGRKGLGLLMLCFMARNFLYERSCCEGNNNLFNKQKFQFLLLPLLKLHLPYTLLHDYTYGKKTSLQTSSKIFLSWHPIENANETDFSYTGNYVLRPKHFS